MRTAVCFTLSALSIGALLSAAPLTAGCREDRPACYEGDLQSCTCSSGGTGYQSCLPSEERFAACVCDGTTPGLDGSIEAAAEASSGGSGELIGFMGACTTNEECETGDCHSFSQQGSFCTHGCKLVTDCPAPSTGCNNRGICKAP